MYRDDKRIGLDEVNRAYAIGAYKEPQSCYLGHSNTATEATQYNFRVVSEIRMFFEDLMREVSSKIDDLKFIKVEISQDVPPNHLKVIIFCSMKFPRQEELNRIRGYIVGSVPYGKICDFQYFDVELKCELEEPIRHLGLEIKYKEDKKMYVPEVVKIAHRQSARGEFFSVFWKDGTKTTVKLMEGDTSDEYTAYLYALGKKLYEDKGKCREFIKEKKKVFEDEMAVRSAEIARKKRDCNIKQSLERQGYESLDEYRDHIYEEMFVPRGQIFKRGGRR